MIDLRNACTGAYARLSFFAVVALLACTPRTAAAQAANVCGEVIEEAETSYVEGRFDEAIQLLLTCLDGPDVETAQAITAYRLLALALIRKDELAEARAAIVQLFDIYPEYEADPIIDPPAYTALVDIVKQQVRPVSEVDEPPPEQSWFRSNMRWLVSGGAVVVGGVLAAVLIGGDGSGSDTLPPPPTVPN